MKRITNEQKRKKEFCKLIKKKYETNKKCIKKGSKKKKWKKKDKKI